MTKTTLAASAALIALLSANNSFAAENNDTAQLKAEIQSMRKLYENRIAELEAKIEKIEKDNKAKISTAQAETEQQKPAVAAETSSNSLSPKSGNANSFNPAIGAILNGRYSNFSTDTSELKGFGASEEGLSGTEGFSLGESEINISANADNKLYGKITAALESEDGEDKLGIEEAYIKTLPGSGIPTGTTLKAGRALWNFGYLNEHHAHSDDFADRPLPYRIFLNNGFKDDGVQLSYVLPTDLYSEIGGGAFRGDGFPGGSAKGEGAGSYSAYARIGGDIGQNQNWRLGTSFLKTHTPGRITNDDNLTFVGDNNLYGADLRYTWAPTGNAREKELTLQSEYLLRHEDGTYNDNAASTGSVAFNDSQSGWYAQGTYKFLPSWRVGARYSLLNPASAPAGLVGSSLDAKGHNPDAYSLMTDWSNSEFSRVRLQYNREDLSGKEDNQIILQYILSLGAHGAHKY